MSCTICGKKIPQNAVGYVDDHICFTKRWGYHSPYDGEVHDVTICEPCYTALCVG